MTNLNDTVPASVRGVEGIDAGALDREVTSLWPL